MISKKRILTSLLVIAMIFTMIPFTATTANAAGLVITLDPGHGGSDPGALGSGINEATANWEITTRVKANLESAGCTVYLTRGQNTNPSLSQRCAIARDNGSAGIVSIHQNSYTSASANGTEILVPNSNYRPTMAATSVALANTILPNLVNLGLSSRGLLLKNGSSKYPDGSAADYYGIIRYSKSYGLDFGILIECGFITNAANLAIIKNFDAVANAISSGILSYFNINVVTSSYINCIDNPASTTGYVANQAINVSGIKYKGNNNSLYINGWSVHSEGISRYQYDLDGGDWYNINAYFRDDVRNAVGYENCTKNAFSTTLDVTNWSEGTHTVGLRGFNANESVIYTIGTVTITIKNEFETGLTAPYSGTAQATKLTTSQRVTNGDSDSIPISGWHVHCEGIGSYSYYVENTSVSGTLNKSYSSSVASSQSDFTACNDYNSFNGSVDMSSLPAGNYTIVLTTTTKTGNKYNFATIPVTYTPVIKNSLNTNKTYYGKNEAIIVDATTIKGTTATVSMYKDGDTIGTTTPLYTYGFNTSSSFDLKSLTINSGRKDDFTEGKYYVVLFDSTGVAAITKTIYITTWKNVYEDAYDGFTYESDDLTVDIKVDVNSDDYPTYVFSGYTLHTNMLSDIKYSVDGGAFISANTYYDSTIEDEYVGDYPSAAGMSYFDFETSLASLSYGAHTVKVVAYAEAGYTYEVINYTLNISGANEIVSSDEETLVIDRDTDGSFAVIEPGMSSSDILALINSGCAIVDANGNAVSGNIGTGVQIVFKKNGVVLDTLEVVVLGDIDGDGVVNAKDMLKARKVKAGSLSVEGSYFRAIDVSDDGTVEDIDLSSIAELIVK